MARWLVVFVLWFGAGMFVYTRLLLWAQVGNFPSQWGDVWLPILLRFLLKAAIWTSYTPLVIRLQRRFSFQSSSWRVPLLVHLAAGAGFAVVSVGIDFVFARAVYPPFLPFSLVSWYSSWLHVDVFFYLIAVGLLQVLHHQRRSREQEVQSAALEAQVAVSELEAVQMRLRPELVFPVLAAVRRTLREDPDEADLLVSNFGDLLRAMIASAGTPFQTVEEELDALDLYLEVREGELGDRGLVEAGSVDDVRDALVPSFIIQALVEEVLALGVETGRSRRFISVRVRNGSGRLSVTVSDGPAARARENGAPSDRLRGIQNQLNRLFGPGAWSITSSTGDGTTMITLDGPLTEDESVLLQLEASGWTSPARPGE
ncbi:MAG TPA: histidine kinase [Gemmatimonadales bacterium]|nr:histidine kinase [Gemmatimonadales bacterium]